MLFFNQNYLVFFCDPGLIVLTCFFLFLFFAILSEKGFLISSSRQAQMEGISKLSRSLAYRASMLWELVLYIDRSITRVRTIAASYGAASHDVVLLLGRIACNSPKAHAAFRSRQHMQTLSELPSRVTQDARGHFARGAFVGNFFGIFLRRFRLRLV